MRVGDGGRNSAAVSLRAVVSLTCCLTCLESEIDDEDGRMIGSGKIAENCQDQIAEFGQSGHVPVARHYQSSPQILYQLQGHQTDAGRHSLLWINN